MKDLNLGCIEIKFKTKCKIILMLVVAPIVLMAFMGILVFGMTILIN